MMKYLKRDELEVLKTSLLIFSHLHNFFPDLQLVCLDHQANKVHML
jgi:hypothetical protein